MKFNIPRKTEALLIIIAAVPFLYNLVAPILMGADHVYRIHDFLDSVGPMSVLISQSALYVFNPESIVSGIFIEQPRAFFGSPFNFGVNVTYHFGVLNGLVINNLIIRLTALVSMFLLLRRWHPLDRERAFVLSVSLLFAALPTFIPSGLSFMSIPAFILIEQLVAEKGMKVRYVFISIWLCSYSFLFHIGMFVILIFFVMALYRTFYLKKFHPSSYTWLLILCLTYTLLEYQLFYVQLSETDILSHRIDRLTNSENALNFFGLLGMSFIKIFEGNYHASYYPGWLILGFAFIISFFRFRGTQLLVNRLNILLLSMCMIGVVSTFFDTRMLLRVKEFIPILNVINFGRIDYALSALVFIVLGESMFGFMHFRIPVWLKHSIIFGIVAGISIWAVNYSREFVASNGHDAPSFRDYFLNDSFDELRLFLKSDIDFSESAGILNLGINPVICQFHGIPTIGGYGNSYPLEHKRMFQRLVQPSIDRNQFWGAQLKAWGNRCYLPFSTIRTVESIDEVVNLAVMRKMDIKYILSRKIFKEQAGVRLVNSYFGKEEYWGVCYLYSVQ